MPDFLGFQYRVILDLYRILFHAVVIFGPEHDFLFKSAATYCGSLKFFYQKCLPQQNKVKQNFFLPDSNSEKSHIVHSKVGSPTLVHSALLLLSYLPKFNVAGGADHENFSKITFYSAFLQARHGHCTLLYICNAALNSNSI